MDSDDYIDREMYETMLAAMKRTDCGIACCGRYIVRGNEKTSMHGMVQEMVFSSKDVLREMLLGGAVEEAAWDKVYRAELFEGLQFPVGEINEDIVIMPYFWTGLSASSMLESRFTITGKTAAVSRGVRTL